MYGKAGAYRLKSYGAEHRALSSYLMSKDEYITWVFAGVMDAIEFVNYGGIISNPKDIVRAINESDTDLVREILDEYNIDIPKFVEEEACVAL
jgi:hypothetical protein